MENQKTELNMTSKTGLFEIKGVQFDNRTSGLIFDNKKDEFLFKLILEIKSKASPSFNDILSKKAICCLHGNKEIHIHIRYGTLTFVVYSDKEREELNEFREFTTGFVDEIYEIYSKAMDSVSKEFNKTEPWYMNFGEIVKTYAEAITALPIISEKREEEPKRCKFKSECPCRSGWCETQEPDYSKCVYFLMNHIDMQRQLIERQERLLKISNSETYVSQKVNMQNCADSLYIHFEEFRKQVNEIRDNLEKSFKEAARLYEAQMNDIRERLAPSVMKKAMDVYKQGCLDCAKLTPSIMKGVNENVEEERLDQDRNCSDS